MTWTTDSSQNVKQNSDCKILVLICRDNCSDFVSPQFDKFDCNCVLKHFQLSEIEKQREKERKRERERDKERKREGERERVEI